MSGLPLALRAARHGKVAFVEREQLGGTCLNRGCIPTKTMIASSTVAQQARRAEEFGVHVSPPTVDLAAVVDRKDRLVESIRSGSYRTVENAENVDFFQADGLAGNELLTCLSSPATVGSLTWPTDAVGRLSTARCLTERLTNTVVCSERNVIR